MYDIPVNRNKSAFSKEIYIICLIYTNCTIIVSNGKSNGNEKGKYTDWIHSCVNYDLTVS